MQSFTYHAPTSISEALQLFAKCEGTIALLAGGTDILVQLRENHRQADHVIDVKHIPELHRLGCDPTQGLVLGAAVTCSQVLHSDATQDYSALRDSAQIIGGWQIQTRASIGGNLCNSSPAADSVPSLIALGAEVDYATLEGRQTIPVREFCTGPGTNILNRRGLLIGMHLPPVGARSGSAYERFIPRYEMDIAVACAASYVELDNDGTISAVRIALGAVGPKAIGCPEAANLLVGKAADDELIQKVADQAATMASPINDMRGTIEFREHLASVLVKRTLQTALRRAAGEVIVSHPH
ncbi:xanthine dehydrogenase family protein subunit M [bacterium]|nr:xanthine dehydrogenase family protein subunit M [bacterium]